MTGTLINGIAIIIGGLIGFFFGKLLKQSWQDTLCITCGVATLFIGISGALEGMMKVEGTALTSGRSLLIIVCLAIGALIGEMLDIEGGFESFGEWLKVKSGNSKDKMFVDGFVTASLTVCIGAMAIVGAIQDGLLGDYSILLVKAILDLIIIMVMTCSMGKGCIFSFIPVVILQGSVSLLARLLEPFITEPAMANLSLIGSILIFCVGVNLVWGKKIKVANLLPSLIVAVVVAFLPISL